MGAVLFWGGSVLGRFCFRKALLHCLVAGSFICFGDAAVKAAVIINAVQSGSSVIFSYSGQLNLTGLGASGSEVAPFFSFIDSASGAFIVNGSYDAYQFSGPLAPFGEGTPPGKFGSASVASGFAIVNLGDIREVRVPSGYTSNASLSGSVTFADADFSSLGLTPGSYTTTLPSDSITMNIGAVPAPLPLLGLGAAAAFSRKLKQRIALRRKREEVGDAG